jgi:hypothetical protein
VGTGTGAALANAPVPDASSRIQRADVYLRYRLNERVSVRGAWLHERGRISDWAWDGIDPTSVVSVLGMGERTPDYRLNWFTLRLQYRLH